MNNKSYIGVIWDAHYYFFGRVVLCEKVRSPSDTCQYYWGEVGADFLKPEDGDRKQHL